MDLLSELIFVLNQYQATIPDSILPRNSKLRRLYNLIAKGKANTDEEAAQLVYGSSPKDKKYLMLKRSLVTKLADLLLATEPTNTIYKDNYSNVQFVCEQKLAITEKLLLQNVYHNAERIIQKIQQKAEKYHLIFVQLRCAQQLRTIHALKGFPSETEMYDKAVGILAKHTVYESRAQGFAQIIQSKIKFFISYNPSLVSDAKRFSTQIQSWLTEFESPFLKLYFYRVQLAWQQQELALNEWQVTLQALEQLPKDFPFLRSNGLLLEIQLAWARYYQATREFNAMKVAIDHCLQLSDYQAFNKFEVMGLYFDWTMRTQDWDSATEIIQEIYKTSQFESLDPIDISCWGIRALYLHFILITQNQGAVPAMTVPKLLQKKHAYEFLSGRQPVSKDKKGYNLHLVVLRLLFQMVYNRQDTSNDGNKMLVYYQRHLKLLEDRRTGVFFKILAKLASNNFDRIYIQKRSLRFQDQLADPQLHNDACEVIEYQELLRRVIRLSGN